MTTATTLQKFITLAEAARLLGVSKQRVSFLAREGRLGTVTPLGVQSLLSREAVLAFARLDRPAHRPKKSPDKSRKTAVSRHKSNRSKD